MSMEQKVPKNQTSDISRGSHYGFVDLKTASSGNDMTESMAAAINIILRGSYAAFRLHRSRKFGLVCTSWLVAARTPKDCKTNFPKPIERAHLARMLHTVGVPGSQREVLTGPLATSPEDDFAILHGIWWSS